MHQSPMTALASISMRNSGRARPETLRPGEFGPAFPRQMLNLQRLVNDATDRAREEGFVDTTGLRVAQPARGYGRYLRVGGKDSAWAQAWFGVHFELWAQEVDTPLWIQFNGEDMSLEDIRERLDLDDDYDYFVLPTDREYEAVLDSVVDQLHEIAEAIGRSEQ